VRQLTDFEKLNLKVFIDKGIEAVLIEPTATGLKKSILDATSPVRKYLKKMQIHDYELQGQGPNNKVQKEFFYCTEKGSSSSTASLYRPNTKSGDPRIWFKGLTEYAMPNDVIAIFSVQGDLCLTNISRIPIHQLYTSSIDNIFKDILSADISISNTAEELLLKLQKIAKSGPHKTLNNSDTGVGETLEHLLGIEKNSSRNPDYKGIELKTHRKTGAASRVTLFAQVADWSRSKLKSSAEILDNFGYHRDGSFKLYCEVSTRVRNSQGLKFKLDYKKDILIENSDKIDLGDFAVWELNKLHDRLESKHKETFWIKSENIKEDGIEYFDYKEVTHTRSPITSQFDLLLSQGDITMDHLIKRNVNNRVVEKGPLFRIKKNSINFMFPSSIIHNLY
tara:strand:+ start:215 stop:1393 length:1179 start_codon:yes stop_codon:yes gene_type:complete